VTIGQAPGTQQTGLVSIKADGTDVHEVLKSLFGQAKKNYVLEPGIHFALYLSLEGVEFDEALGIVCHLAKLKNELRDGIYYVGPDNGDVKPTGKPIELTPPVKPAKPAKPTQTGPVSKPKVASAGSLTSGALYKKRVNVRFAKTDIRSVFSELGRQGQVTIVVDKSVPNYKLDVVLRHTSLLYAMQRITKAAGLTFGVENGQIKVVGKASATTASGKTASNPS
jgi:type II secretory pathway component GspD/PulD (secretin)